MNRRSSWRVALLVCVPALIVVFGLHRLFQLLYADGARYPHYSSHSAEPLGARLLYDSLADLPGRRVSRHYGTPSELQADESTVVFLLGLAPDRHFPRTAETLAGLAARGARVIVGLDATVRPWQETNSLALLAWDVRLHAGRAAPGPSDSIGEIATLPADAAFHPLPWNPLWRLEPRSDDWRVLYAYDGRPALIERNWGRGSLALAADSAPFVNETLLRQSHPALLARLAGARPRLIFHESHLGLGQERNLAMLLRRYRLHGLGAALIWLGLLFLWKMNACLLPPEEEDRAASPAQVVLGMDSAEGYAHLLRRAVSGAELGRVCVDEWVKTADGSSQTQARTARLRAALPSADSGRKAAANALDVYMNLSRIAHAKTDKTKTGTMP
jgi:hypothetical protein